jgi:hypothetical protein
MPALTLQSVVTLAPNQLSSELAGGAVILNLADGTYYGLDAVGAAVWRMLDRPRTVAELRDAVLAEFEVEPGECEADLIALLHELESHALVGVRDDDPS